MISLQCFAACLCVVVAACSLVVLRFACSRSFYKDLLEQGELLDKAYRRERRADIDHLIKKLDLVKEERDFWRLKAIQLGYPAARDEVARDEE